MEYSTATLSVGVNQEKPWGGRSAALAAALSAASAAAGTIDQLLAIGTDRKCGDAAGKRDGATVADPISMQLSGAARARRGFEIKDSAIGAGLEG